MERIKVVLGFYHSYELQETLDCGNEYLRNWSDIEISLSRKDYTGVVRSISTKFEFVGDAKEKVLQYYEQDYLTAQAKVNVYQVTEQWDYELIFQGVLDFGTIEHDGYTLSINAKDNSLASLINANKSTKYDIECNDIVESKQFYYNRPNILNRVQWTTDDNEETTNEPYQFSLIQTLPAPQNSYEQLEYYIPIPLAYMETETYRAPFVFQDQTGGVRNNVDYEETVGCVKVIKNEASFRLYADFDLQVNSIPNGSSLFVMIGNTNYILSQQPITGTLINHIELNASIANMRGSTIGLFLRVVMPDGYVANKTETINITYYSRKEKEGYYDRGSILFAEAVSNGNDISYNCVKPIRLLSAIIDKINTMGIEYQCLIDDSDVNCVVVPGEIISKYQNPKIHTSFNDFVSFMQCCYGFTYTIDNNTIRFGSRDNLFADQMTKTIGNYSDVSFAQDTSLIYSSVRVGYDESNDNKNEYNLVNEYSTGVSLTDNTLELISPYRADTYGLEKKVQDVESDGGESTTEDSEDNDIYIVDVIEEDDYYTARKECKVFAQDNIPIVSNDTLGIKNLFIINELDEKYELGKFANYYITSIRSVYNDGATYIRIEINIVFGVYDEYRTLSQYVKSILVPISAQGVETYSNDEIIITADWDIVKDSEFVIDDNDLILYPISHIAYDRGTFNYLLSPELCARRNKFIITPTTLQLTLTSGNTDTIFWDGDILRNGNISFDNRTIKVDTLSFNTSDTILPINKSGLVSINIQGKTYQGWIIETSQNIGRNEPSEYQLIIKSDS